MTVALTPAQMAEEVDLSIDTLRYYEKAGLMPPVQRLPNGHRRYTQSDIDWLELVKCLRGTGMPIRNIQRYAYLAECGDHTAEERVELLAQHRREVLAQLDELQRNLTHINEKLAYYSNALGVTPTETQND